MLSVQLAPLTAGTVASSWRLDPVGLVLAGLLGGAYLLGVRKVHSGQAGQAEAEQAKRAGLSGLSEQAGQAGQGGRSERLERRRWPVSRSVAFLLGGVGVLILTTCSFLGVYAPVLRWVAVIQACLILLVCPLLFGLGAPVALLHAVRPSVSATATSPRSAWRRLPGRLFQATLQPGVGPLILLAVTALLVFTPWLGWAQEYPAARALSLLALLAAGLLLVLPITDEAAQVSSLAYAAMLGLGLLEFLLDAIPGMVLRLNSHLVAAGYWAGVQRPWGPSPLADQRLAGDWLWFFAEAGDLPFLLILIRAWIRADAKEAAHQDAVLDLLELENDAGDGLMRPWWRTEGDDPRRN